VVVNLTVPSAHAAVSVAALSAGKHVFSEKPLATDLESGRRVIATAESRGLLVGCAPDTFLGAAGRLARKLIDEGAVGRVLSGTAFVMSHGMEHWHPDPEFFFKPGGGPVLDVGPYYVTMLVNLLGPVAGAFALTATGFTERLVSAEGPRKGHRITVETPTSAMALLHFASGAQVIFGASWDVWKHSHPPIELYGTEGSLRIPDPNFFGGTVEISDGNGEWNSRDTGAMALGAINWPAEAPRVANNRALGVADLVAAVRSGRAHHTSGRLALHVLEVMDAILHSGETGMPIEIKDQVKRPPILAERDAARLLPS
jgi:predicted dehydrogenase